MAPPLPIGDIPAKRAEKRDDEKNARRWAFTRAIAPFFDRAIEVYLRDHDDQGREGGTGMKASAFAELIGVDATTLSKMRAGERIIDADHLEPLRAYPPTALVLTQGDLSRVGLVAVVRRRPVVTAAAVREKIIDRVKHDATLRRIILPDVAEELGVDVEDVEAALEVDEEQDGQPTAPEVLNQGATP